MANHTLDDYTGQYTAIAPLKSDKPLAKLFPVGVPVIIPDTYGEPTVLIDDDEYYEVPLEHVGDSKLGDLASLYSSDRVPPVLAASYAIDHRVLVPASWIGVAA